MCVCIAFGSFSLMQVNKFCVPCFRSLERVGAKFKINRFDWIGFGAESVRVFVY